MKNNKKKTNYKVSDKEMNKVVGGNAGTIHGLTEPKVAKVIAKKPSVVTGATRNAAKFAEPSLVRGDRKK